MKDIKDIYNNYLSDKNIKKSAQRERILDVFLKTEDHLSIQELFDIVKKNDKSIGLATVYRAMKIICDAGLARELEIGDGTKRYEHKYEHRHHDHLVCERCGKLIEFYSPDIEKMQEEICRKFGFKMHEHKMQIYGICRNCKK